MTITEETITRTAYEMIGEITSSIYETSDNFIITKCTIDDEAKTIKIVFNSSKTILHT